MKLSLPSVLAPTLLALALAATASAQAPVNLVGNGAFTLGSGRDVPHWTFPKLMLERQGDAASVINWGSEANAEGDRYLTIGVEEARQAHVWWQHETRADAGATYVLTVRASGELPLLGAPGSGPIAGFASADVGIYFQDATGRWIGYERIPDTRYPFDWKTLTLRVTAPDNAARLGIRLGISCTAAANARYDDVVLVRE